MPAERLNGIGSTQASPVGREHDADLRQLAFEPQRQLFKEFLIFLSILSGGMDGRDQHAL